MACEYRRHENRLACGGPDLDIRPCSDGHDKLDRTGVQPAALGIALGFALTVTIWLDVTHGKGPKSSSD